MNHRKFLILLLLFALGTPLLVAQKNLEISDDVIYDMVRRKLANDPDVKGGGLTIEVKQGAVVLNGTVESEKQKERAGKLTRKIKGVRSVENRLVIASKAAR